MAKRKKSTASIGIPRRRPSDDNMSVAFRLSTPHRRHLKTRAAQESGKAGRPIGVAEYVRRWIERDIEALAREQATERDLAAARAASTATA